MSSIWSLEYLIGSWRPSFHDDHFVGWLITGSYLACSILAALYATFLHQMEDKRACKLWFLISCLMVLLGINKQLALQMLFAEMGRQVAHAQGWYDHRRIVQLSFIVIFATSLTAVFVWFTKAYLNLFRRYRLAFCGLFFLLGFVIIRAATFHRFGEIIQYDLHGITLNWVLELAGIYMIILTELKEMMASWIRNT